MSRDIRLMSRQEAFFVRFYALALKRHFSLFVSALNMMRVTELGLKCPIEAARLARELNNLHADFEHTLMEITRNNRFRVKPDGVAHPTADEITQIIQVSFFKLVEAEKKHPELSDLGWFSGHPLEWEKVWKQPSKPDLAGTGTIASALINALANLFKMGYSAKFKQPPAEPYEEPDEDDDWYEDDDYDHH